MGLWISQSLNHSGSLQSSPISNVLPGTDKFHNPLTSDLLLSPSLPICPWPSSSSSMHLTKANKGKTSNPKPIIEIPDSKMPTETTRRSTLVVLGVERPNSSGKARKTKCSPLLLLMMTPSLDFHSSSNLQIVYISWTSLQIRQNIQPYIQDVST